MNQDLTDITVLVDRSGSMATIRSDMEGGFNEFLREQKEIDGQCKLSLYTFDGTWSYQIDPIGRNGRTKLQLEEEYVARNIKDAGKLRLHPRGNTPLLDALGTVIERTGNRFRAMHESDRPGRVLFVIITDGLENASEEYDKYTIRHMIKKQEERYNWHFIYLGANHDAIATGANLGMKYDTVATYNATKGGVKNMAKTMSSKVRGARSCSIEAYNSGEVLNFSDKERTEMGIYSD
jgi:hypothetical protein